MKKLMVVMMALAVSSVVFAEEVEPAREAVDHAHAITGIEHREARLDAMDAAGAEFGPAVLEKLRAGEKISHHESILLNWHVRNDARGRVDLGLLREVLSIRQGHDGHNSGLIRTLARQPGVSDAEIIAVASPGLLASDVYDIHRRRVWDSTANRDTFLAATIQPRLAQGYQGSSYQIIFRRYVQSLSAADALPVLENEIRALLSREPSPERDDWIKELRAQHVILRDLAGD